jgi:hypothetical protein
MLLLNHPTTPEAGPMKALLEAECKSADCIKTLSTAPRVTRAAVWDAVSRTAQVLHGNGLESDAQAVLKMRATLMPDHNIFSMGAHSGPRLRKTAHEPNASELI